MAEDLPLPARARRTGGQAHSVRGFLADMVQTKPGFGLSLDLVTKGRGRVHRIARTKCGRAGPIRSIALRTNR